MKLLTDEIIEAELEKRGVSEEQIVSDPSGFTERVLNHYGARVDDHWADQDLYVYEESTRDGYTVWVCTHNPNSICIAEEIFYRESSSEILSEIQDAIRNGGSIYCDASELIDEAIEDMIESFYDDTRADVELELINQGYVWPVKVPQLLQRAWGVISKYNADNQYNNLLDQINAAIDQCEAPSIPASTSDLECRQNTQL